MMISSIHLGDVAGQNHVTDSHPVYVKHIKEISCDQVAAEAPCSCRGARVSADRDVYL